MSKKTPAQAIYLGIAFVSGVLQSAVIVLVVIVGYASLLTSLVFYVSIAGMLVATTQLLFRHVRPSHKLASKLTLSIVVSVACLLCADLGLRFVAEQKATYTERNGGPCFSPYPRKWELRRHNVQSINSNETVRKVEFQYEYKTNSEGIRDREHVKNKPAGELRILGIGDSFTEGEGAVEFEDTWLQQMAANFNARSYGRQHVLAISGGVSGSDACFGLMLLKERLLAYEPDIVIVAVNRSDINDCIVRGGMERFTSDGIQVVRHPPSWEWIYANSFIFRHIAHDILDLDSFYIPTASADALRNRAIEDIGVAMQEFVKLSHADGFRLLFVIHPHRKEVLGNSISLAPLLAEVPESENVSVLNLLEYFNQNPDINSDTISEYYWPIDQHHTPKGYKIFAAGVTDRLQQLGWIE